jgi:hypothetical protein
MSYIGDCKFTACDHSLTMAEAPADETLLNMPASLSPKESKAIYCLRWNKKLLSSMRYFKLQRPPSP